MEGSLAAGPAGRMRLLEMYRRHPDPAVRQRAHIVLLLLDGRSWSEVESVLYCSRRTIAIPERVEEPQDGTRHYLARIPERDGRVLRVVVNPGVDPPLVVSAFLDPRMRGRMP